MTTITIRVPRLVEELPSEDFRRFIEWSDSYNGQCFWTIKDHSNRVKLMFPSEVSYIQMLFPNLAITVLIK